MSDGYLLILIVASFCFNLVTAIALYRLQQTYSYDRDIFFSRVNYLEMGMSYSHLIPLPWELEEFENDQKETKHFKKEGNVVYLQDD